jgi:Mg-chelatase subunit ChlD
MLRASPVLRLVLPLLFGAACAEIDHSVDGGPTAKPDASGILLDVRLATDKPPCIEPGLVRIQPVPTDVLLLLDRSSTMEVAFGSGSRYQAAAGLLSDLVATYQDRVRFGYMEMPGRTGCETQTPTCCVSPPSVPVAPGSAAAVISALGQAAPLGGGTPMAAALFAAGQYFVSSKDSMPNRYVLLATDGGPSCTVSGALISSTSGTSAACDDAKTQVDTLGSSVGVKVIVLSVGADAAATDDSECLEALAKAGGMAASGRHRYYTAEDPVQLQNALEQAFGALSQPSCFLSIPQVDKRAPVRVLLDDQEIPYGDENGWRWADSTTVQITGAYCKQIQQFQVSSFVASYYGCESNCVDRGECTGPPPPS